MRRIIPIILAVVLLFSGCSKKDAVTYDLIVCDSELTTLSEYLGTFSSENCKVENIQFVQEQIDLILDSVKKSDDTVNSITLYGENISEDQAVQFIKFAEKRNIPVIFSFAEISNEILESYDKAYSVHTDYINAAEITAEKITDLWRENIIIDEDRNYIFKFAVIKDENITADMQNYLDTLLYCMELYGIPMQLTETIDSADITSVSDLEAIKDENEGVIAVSDIILPLLSKYSVDGDGVEIITLSHNSKNIYSENSAILNCLIDYTQYTDASSHIIENYNQRQYLLENFPYLYVNKTIYIPATV